MISGWFTHRNHQQEFLFKVRAAPLADFKKIRPLSRDFRVRLLLEDTEERVEK